MRFREAILEAADELVRIVSQQDSGDTFLARGNEDGAEGGLSDSEPDLLARAPIAVLRGCHAEHVRRLLIESSAGIESSVVDCLGNGVA